MSMPILALHNPRIVVIFIVVAGHAVMAYLGSSPVRVAGIAPSHSAVAGDSAVAASEAVAGGVNIGPPSRSGTCPSYLRLCPRPAQPYPRARRSQ